VERELGAGGMATVFLAHDLRHEREVAIEVLHPDLGAALGGERFLAEIKTTARLQHPHILPLLDSLAVGQPAHELHGGLRSTERESHVAGPPIPSLRSPHATGVHEVDAVCDACPPNGRRSSENWSPAGERFADGDTARRVCPQPMCASSSCHTLSDLQPQGLKSVATVKAWLPAIPMMARARSRSITSSGLLE
jgi:serine/threonine protein kinase